MISLTNLTLGKKITLLTALGLLVGFGVFSTLGMRAVNQATETMLQDRLTTASLVADYLDEALGHALTELNDTAALIETNRTQEELGPQIEALEDAFFRLSIQIHGIYLLNQEGIVIWSKLPIYTLANGQRIQTSSPTYPIGRQANRCCCQEGVCMSPSSCCLQPR